MFISLIYWDDGVPAYCEPTSMSRDVDGNYFVDGYPQFLFARTGWQQVSGSKEGIVPCMKSHADVIAYVHHDPAVCQAYVEGFYSGLATGVVAATTQAVRFVSPSLN